MLRITVSKNAGAAVNYYNQGLAKQDYYLSEKEIKGRWHGKTVQMLGLSGTVEKEDFEKMVNNRHPKTGQKLTVRDAVNRRAGYDYTFSAPKSASILYGLTGDKDILQAHQTAVQKAMDEVERDMQTRITKNGQRQYETTGNIAYAAFDHFTSRPVEMKKDQPLESDPQLHTHCFVFNCSYSNSQKRFQAIEEGNVHRQANYYEAIYHSHLSHQLKKAGYQIERTKKFWEVKTFDKKLIDKFSNRSLEIERLAKGENLTAKQKAALGALTRKNKNQLKVKSDLKTIWQQRLTAQENLRIKSAKGKVNQQEDKEQKTLTAKKYIDLALEHLLERKSVAAQKKVLAHAMQLGYGKLTPKEIKAAFQQRKVHDLISAKENTIEYVTTKEMVKKEDRIIKFASSTKGKLRPLCPNYKIKQDFLNPQQCKAIRHILESRDQVTILSGGAGVGKSTLLSEVKAGIEQKNKQIFAFAPSADASRKNLREKGFQNADTIAKFLHDEKLQAQTQQQVILIDEAGMVGTKTMDQIFTIAKKQRARVILSGDYRQHSSVEAGDALRLLEKKSGLHVARVSEVVRQRGNKDYKQAIKALSKGNVKGGFKKLDRMGCIVEIEDRQKREEQIASDYLQSVQARKTAIVISPTHFEGNRISTAIRNKLKQNNLLKKEEKSYPTQRNLSFTEAQKKDVKLYEVGMRIQFHQNVTGGFKAGERYDVLEQKQNDTILVKHQASQQILNLPVTHSQRFQVFEKTTTAVAKGEIIRITNNGRTKEKNRIYNGQTYEVTGFTKTGDIKLSNGKTLDKSFGNFQHGYAQTSHSVQGRDAQNVFIAQSASSFPASNNKQFYVSTSRGVEQCKIYTDDKEELKRVVARSGDRMTAQEIREQQQKMTRRQTRNKFYTRQVNKNFEYERPITKQPKKEISKSKGFKFG